jgi:glycosyltransferase involved in cell wall biosynthesis
VLTVTRICPNKGTDLVLEAFARINAQVPEAHLKIVGGTLPGQEAFYKKLLQRTKDLGLQDHVTFLGWQQYPEPFYREAAVLLQLPRVQETFGRTLVEAALYGVPSVAWARGGMTEILGDGVSGFLVPPEDVEAAADRVVALLKTPTRAVEMGDVARECAIERFSEEAYLHAMLKVYRYAAPYS